MVQAARSGKQNIAEASVASGTSKESEQDAQAQSRPLQGRVSRAVYSDEAKPQSLTKEESLSFKGRVLQIKLTNVARASLEELLIDYRDFLRLRGLQEWTKDHP